MGVGRLSGGCGKAALWVWEGCLKGGETLEDVERLSGVCRKAV